MSTPKKGWTVFCSESVCEVMESMPTMRKFFVDFFCDFATKAGTAIDLGHPPPGTPQKKVNDYSLPIVKSGIFIEYTVKADIREFFITRMLCRW